MVRVTKFVMTKKKPGRPRSDEPREQVPVRMSASEKSLMTLAAEIDGYKLTTWLRVVGLRIAALVLKENEK